MPVFPVLVSIYPLCLTGPVNHNSYPSLPPHSLTKPFSHSNRASQAWGLMDICLSCQLVSVWLVCFSYPRFWANIISLLSKSSFRKQLSIKIFLFSLKQELQSILPQSKNDVIDCQGSPPSLGSSRETTTVNL